MNNYTTVALEAAGDQIAGFSLADMLPIAVMVVLLIGLYFLMMRPQRKREKQLKEELSKLTVGDKIVTIGGIVGTVANIKDDEVTISTSIAHTMITFNKSAINTIIKRES